MGTKNNPGKYDCYAAAEPDEPLFVLRATDPLAPNTIRGWAMNRCHQIASGVRPNTPEQWEKIAEAFSCATNMETWRAVKFPAPQGIIVVGPAEETENPIKPSKMN
jgi:hypothetical protein